MNDIYAVIKLVSGEEIFGQVEEFYDEQVKAIMVIDPCIIKEIPSRRGNFSFYKVEGWIKLSEDRIFCLEMKHIMLYTRCDDEEIIATYKKWVRSLNKDDEESSAMKVGVSTSMGYVSSVDDARESLERIFKLKENS
jgi:hypothetical protein